MEGEDRRQMTRFGAWLFGAAAVVTLIGLVLPHQPQADEAGLAAIAAAAAVVAALLRFGGAWAARLARFAPAAGILLVSLALLFNGERNGGDAGGDEMYYLWAALYAAHFLGRRATAAHVLLIAVAYAVTLVAIDPGAVGASRWVSTVGLVIGAAVVARLLSEQVERLVSDLEAAARTDTLTGLQNRRAFREAFAREAQRAARTGRPFALIFADLDGLKALNDRSGHAAGDSALAALGRLLRDELRTIDVAARVGGDEFAILLPESDEAEARAVGDRLAARAEDRFSFGVAVFGRDGLTLDDLARVADKGLYAAKRAFRLT
jgi:diguanylate cyclase (GGDEF)-like protein